MLSATLGRLYMERGGRYCPVQEPFVEPTFKTNLLTDDTPVVCSPRRQKATIPLTQFGRAKLLFFSASSFHLKCCAAQVGTGFPTKSFLVAWLFQVTDMGEESGSSTLCLFCPLRTWKSQSTWGKRKNQTTWKDLLPQLDITGPQPKKWGVLSCFIQNPNGFLSNFHLPSFCGLPVARLAVHVHHAAGGQSVIQDHGAQPTGTSFRRFLLLFLSIVVQFSVQKTWSNHILDTWYLYQFHVNI